MGRLFYKDTGSGIPIVLLHGFCETHAVWDEFINHLQGDFRLLVPDIPGFGASDLPENNPLSLEHTALILNDWLTGNVGEKVVVIGHSLGGYLALAMAFNRPGLFSGLGLFHSTAFSDTPDKKMNRNKAIEFVERNGVIPYISSFVPTLFAHPAADAIEKMTAIAEKTRSATIIAYQQAMRDRPDRRDVLMSLNIPVLFIGGDKDGIIPPQDLGEQKKLVKMAEFHMLPDTGHMGMLENPKKTAEIVGDFAGLCGQKTAV